MYENNLITETITLAEAKSLIQCVSHEQSVLLLSAPGIGKSDTVAQAALESGLICKSLLGTQIAPEDVSGIPRIVGERSVFCPPRILLPETPEPFCLFLDELPACSPDIQKAFYSVLLERRIGEHQLPKGTWVVAAGNRVEDRALVRSLSAALINRVTILHVRADSNEWVRWARQHGIRAEIVAFLLFMSEALVRPVPAVPEPFSTPRSWTQLSQAMDLVEAKGLLTPAMRRSLAFGRVSPSDAAIFCAMADLQISEMPDVMSCIIEPQRIPESPSAQWFLVNLLRTKVREGSLGPVSGEQINRFLSALGSEFRFALFVDLVDQWARLGADESMLASLREVIGS
ncbi:MAG: hypothetical protein KDB01_27215 [Planctomycetaceae bacterium]|nr:hypothetical protein [Planctomycetaceae bacterium]